MGGGKKLLHYGADPNPGIILLLSRDAGSKSELGVQEESLYNDNMMSFNII